MAKKQRSTFAKREKEAARLEKQAAKRARRQGLPDPTVDVRTATRLDRDPASGKLRRFVPVTRG